MDKRLSGTKQGRIGLRSRARRRRLRARMERSWPGGRIPGWEGWVDEWRENPPDRARCGVGVGRPCLDLQGLHRAGPERWMPCARVSMRERRVFYFRAGNGQWAGALTSSP
jgi:hypothetical protein